MEDCNYLNLINYLARSYEAVLHWYFAFNYRFRCVVYPFKPSSYQDGICHHYDYLGPGLLQAMSPSAIMLHVHEEKITEWDSTPRIKPAQSTGCPGRTDQSEAEEDLYHSAVFANIYTLAPLSLIVICMEGLEFHCSRGKCPTGMTEPGAVTRGIQEEAEDH